MSPEWSFNFPVPVSLALPDCQLNLRDYSGQLDSQMLPHPNCTIRFAGSPGKGLLVQLKRLNVPCSRGHLQFTTTPAVTDSSSSSSREEASTEAEDENSTAMRRSPFVCGKLEELPSDRRTHYFRGSSRTAEGAETGVVAALSVVNRAVFSIAYRLVDACYNTTLTEASRSIWLRTGRSSSGEPLECYFRIHLPYGYRIKVNVVTNFRDSHVTRSGGNTRNKRRSSSRSSENRSSRTSRVANEDEAEEEQVVSYASAPVNSANNYVYTSVGEGPAAQRFVDGVDLLQSESGGSSTRYRTSDTFMPITSDLHFNYVDNEQSNWPTEQEEEDGLGNTMNEYSSDDCGPGGLSVLLWDGDTMKWQQCYDKYSNSQRISLLSNSNVVAIKVLRQATTTMAGGSGAGGASSESSGFPSLLIEYNAERIDASQCAFGWIAFQQFCMAAVYDKGPLSWSQAETECQRRGGHLVSIRSADQQRLIDRYLKRR